MNCPKKFFLGWILVAIFLSGCGNDDGEKNIPPGQAPVLPPETLILPNLLYSQINQANFTHISHVYLYNEITTPYGG